MIYTYGYGNRNLSCLHRIIRKFDIDCLIDLRAKPYSTHNTEFNQQTLRAHLIVPYIWAGDRLSGCQIIADDDLAWLIKYAKDKKVLIMCCEADPSKCHRNEIARRLLMDYGVQVSHIVKDGDVQAPKLDAVAEQTNLF